jgi:OOP family OmpA-OmpF porin
LGLQYAFTDALMLRGELERYRIDDAVGNKGDIDHLSIGLVYQFGVNPPAAPVARAPAPAPYVAPPPPVMVTTIVPPPPPPPVPVAAPPAPRMPVKVAFSAESLFGFDQAVVLPEGKRQLDKFAADLRGVTFDTVIVTGHTDRIGAHDYNMRLSTRRADAVKAYLVETDAIAPDRISDKGVGGSEPVTKPGECLNKKVSKALIACLQPDRRVEIEVTGTR